MRLFIAVNFPDKVKDSLESAVKRLQKQGVKANWSRREKFHLTFDFLGELHEALRREGLRLENRPYRPHLTLARRLRDRGETVLPNPFSGEIPVTGISLMRSDRVEGKIQYTELYWKRLEE